MSKMALFHLQESLQKLESLDVKRVFPCHGRPFSDIKKAILRSKEKIERYLLDRQLIGNDLIKKIIVYTLLMRDTIKEDDFFPYLMNTYWFKETVDLYFNNEYEMKYNEIMNTFFERGVIKRENGDLFTTVKS
jgi:glyoxylase-like metal-dependent hydrolase (beta-lactamase superfamily II)